MRVSQKLTELKIINEPIILIEQIKIRHTTTIAEITNLLFKKKTSTFLSIKKDGDK